MQAQEKKMNEIISQNSNQDCPKTPQWIYERIRETFRVLGVKNLERLKVLCNAAIPLLGKHGRILNPRVPPGRHVSYDGLLVGGVSIVVWSVLVVAGVVVVFLGVVHGKGVVSRVV